jgi:hypothetical protein
MIQETSLKAFREILPELGHRQLEVLRVIYNQVTANNNIISKILKLPINSVTPRVNELRKKGLVIMSTVSPCPFTGKSTIWWKIANRNLLNFTGGNPTTVRHFPYDENKTNHQ